MGWPGGSGLEQPLRRAPSPLIYVAPQIASTGLGRRYRAPWLQGPVCRKSALVTARQPGTTAGFVTRRHDRCPAGKVLGRGMSCRGSSTVINRPQRPRPACFAWVPRFRCCGSTLKAARKPSCPDLHLFALCRDGRVVDDLWTGFAVRGDRRVDPDGRESDPRQLRAH
jgi:hypothetical protein